MALLATRTRARPRSRRFTPVELAVAFALVGSLLAVAVPTFVREVHESRFVEPVDGLQRLGAAAVAYAAAHPLASLPTASPPVAPAAPPASGSSAAALPPAPPPGPVLPFPPSAALTPSAPPRGKCVADPPGTWDHGTWATLHFAPAAPDAPHCFAFSFDSAGPPARATFRAQAHGDLDGDGITSTFEVTGHAIDGDPAGPALDRGMFVDNEVE